MKTVDMIYFALQAYGVESGSKYGEPIEVTIPDITSVCIESVDEKYNDRLSSGIIKQKLRTLDRLPSRYFPKNNKAIEWKVSSPAKCVVKELKAN